MLLEWWSRTECTLFTDQATMQRLGKEHVVIILNHNFEIDFLCGWTMCERFGVLGVSVAGPGGCWLLRGCEWEGAVSPAVPEPLSCLPAHRPHGLGVGRVPQGLGAPVETRRWHPSPQSTPAAAAGGWRPALGTSRPPGLHPAVLWGLATCVLVARLTPVAPHSVSGSPC